LHQKKPFTEGRRGVLDRVHIMSPGLRQTGHRELGGGHTLKDQHGQKKAVIGPLRDDDVVNPLPTMLRIFAIVMVVTK
jgi:hypothetical protein